MSTPITPIATPVEEMTPHDADAPMTGEQADKLRALAEETGEEFNASLSQEEAAKRIAALSEIADMD